MKPSLQVHPKLVEAFIKYITDRDAGLDNKGENTDLIFKVAQECYPDTFQYIERCAASVFLHLKEPTEENTKVYEIHLLEKYREETKGFTIMQWCKWANAIEATFGAANAKDLIFEYIRNSKRHKIGVVAAAKRDGKVFIGWSKVNKKADKFDKQRGLEIATNRAIKGSAEKIPVSIMPYIGCMRVRASNYFNVPEESIRHAN